MTAPEAMTAPRELVERLWDRARLAGDDPIFHDAAAVLSRVVEGEAALYQHARKVFRALADDDRAFLSQINEMFQGDVDMVVAERIRLKGELAAARELIHGPLRGLAEARDAALKTGGE